MGGPDRHRGGDALDGEWAKSNPSCKLELARFLGGDAPDGKTNKHLATTERHRGGDAPDGKTNKHLVTTDRHRGGYAPDGKTIKH